MSLANKVGFESATFRSSGARTSATGEITLGAEDGLLRHLAVEIDFEVADQDLSEALGHLAGATFILELDLSNVNE